MSKYTVNFVLQEPFLLQNMVLLRDIKNQNGKIVGCKLV